ncbi:hypothetical protein [Arthrobacter psychrochitiniphilus]|uniref:hypothetical protein n=1 Tax=Arthrobacter psychrochitiniphilus TaxID=291045 RepID=UPI0015C73808|nr:hypothetical protein [Arthrobacter psychrochitiniphilus]NYG19211.1 hypothetical protein [Arthrobacter psychrochitiniphilus]
MSAVGTAGSPPLYGQPLLAQATHGAVTGVPVGAQRRRAMRTGYFARQQGRPGLIGATHDHHRARSSSYTKRSCQ